MIDKNYRLFGVVSIMDIVFAFLLAAVVWIALQFSTPQTVSARAGDVQLIYTVELQKKDPDFADKVKIGADLYDSVKGYYLGKILDVTSSPYLEDVADLENNIYRRAPIPGLLTFYIKVEATAQITDQATTVNQYDILVGKEVFVRTQSFASGGYVVVVERGQ